MKNEIDRDPKGRFVVGNSGGPGRPKRQAEEEYLAVLSERITVDVWARIVEKAAADALSGDSKARDWLSRYLLPDPKTPRGGGLRPLVLTFAEADSVPQRAPD